MKCCNCQLLLLSPSPLLIPHHINKHQIWITNKPCILQVKGNGNSLSSSSGINALPSTILLATTSSLPTAKLSVLLQTSAVCLIAYWVANFVVPNFILKDFQSNNTDDDAKNPADDER
ncbi:hypothetical protein ACS0TY_033518 [Phlomoides rotata]